MFGLLVWEWGYDKDVWFTYTSFKFGIQTFKIKVYPNPSHLMGLKNPFSFPFSYIFKSIEIPKFNQTPPNRFVKCFIIYRYRFIYVVIVRRVMHSFFLMHEAIYFEFLVCLTIQTFYLVRCFGYETIEQETMLFFVMKTLQEKSSNTTSNMLN